MEPTFVLSKTIGDNSYEIEGHVDGPLMRLKVTREFTEDDELRRTIQSVVFPLEILTMILGELPSIRDASAANGASFIESGLDQSKSYLLENVELIRELAKTREGSARAIIESVDYITHELYGIEFTVNDQFAAVVRTLALLYLANGMQV